MLLCFSKCCCKNGVINEHVGHSASCPENSILIKTCGSHLIWTFSAKSLKMFLNSKTGILTRYCQSKTLEWKIFIILGGKIQTIWLFVPLYLAELARNKDWSFTSFLRISNFSWTENWLSTHCAAVYARVAGKFLELLWMSALGGCLCNRIPLMLLKVWSMQKVIFSVNRLCKTPGFVSSLDWYVLACTCKSS